MGAGDTFSSSFWRAASLKQRRREFEEQQRRFDEQQKVAGEQRGAEEEKARAQAFRQQEEDVWSRAEQIFKTTGDPNQALGYINKNLNTDFKYEGAKDDWLLFGSDRLGRHAWNWRTGEGETLVEPRPQPPAIQSYDQGSKKITEWTNPETGEVVRKAEAPRWQPQRAEPKDPLQSLVRAYNANLRGIAAEVGMYLQPEEQAALENLPEDSPEWAALLVSSVENAGLPPKAKASLLERIHAVNAQFLPMINRAAGVSMPRPNPTPGRRSTPRGGSGSWDAPAEDVPTKTLDRETAKRFLEEVGGDKEKARERAKKAGFVF